MSTGSTEAPGSRGSDDAGAAALAVAVAELAEALTADSLTVDGVAELVGPVEDDPGIPLEAVLRPTSALLAAASVGRFPDSGLPYVVTLRPAPGVLMTPALLAAQLGEHRRTATHRGMPAELVYARTPAGPEWRVVVMSQVEQHGDDLDDAHVTRITLRRDPE